MDHWKYTKRHLRSMLENYQDILSPSDYRIVQSMINDFENDIELDSPLAELLPKEVS